VLEEYKIFLIFKVHISAKEIVDSRFGPLFFVLKFLSIYMLAR